MRDLVLLSVVGLLALTLLFSGCVSRNQSLIISRDINSVDNNSITYVSGFPDTNYLFPFSDWVLNDNNVRSRVMSWLAPSIDANRVQAERDVFPFIDGNISAFDLNIMLTCQDANNDCYATYYRVDGTDSFIAPYPYLWIAKVYSNGVFRINPMTNLLDANVNTPTYGTSAYHTGMAVDANGNVWAPNYDGNTVSRINPVTKTVLATISVGKRAYGVAVDANQGVWVTDTNSNMVSHINPATNNVDFNIATGLYPKGIAVDANQNVWVTISGENKVSRINPLTNSIDVNVSVGSNPSGIAVDANQKIWVTNYGDKNVSRINPATNNVDLNVGVGDKPWGIAVDANNNVWVGNYNDQSVSRISPITNTVTKTITNVGASLDGVAIDANQNVWAVSRFGNAIFRINPVRNTIDLNISFDKMSLSWYPIAVGDFTGFALQNFVLSHGWRMYGGLNDNNVFIKNDGKKHKLEYYSINSNGVTMPLKTLWLPSDCGVNGSCSEILYSGQDANVHDFNVRGFIYAGGGDANFGTDYVNNASMIFPMATYLYSRDSVNNLRKIIGVSTAGVIDIGQSPTAILTGINFNAGTKGTINFKNNGDVNRVTMLWDGNFGINTSTPNATLDVNGHIDTSGVKPVVSSCGVTPTNVGTDVAGKVTIGTGVTTSCLITFNSVWNNAPACITQDESGVLTIKAASTTSTLTLTTETSIGGSVISYICFGY